MLINAEGKISHVCNRSVYLLTPLSIFQSTSSNIFTFLQFVPSFNVVVWFMKCLIASITKGQIFFRQARWYIRTNTISAMTLLDMNYTNIYVMKQGVTFHRNNIELQGFDSLISVFHVMCICAGSNY